MRNFKGPRAVIAIGLTLLVACRAIKRNELASASAAASANVRPPVQVQTPTSTRPTSQSTSLPLPRPPSGKSGSLLDVGFDLMNKGLGTGARIADQAVGLTPEEAAKVGAAAHKLILSKHRVVDRPNDLRRITTAADPFLQGTPNTFGPIRFFIIDDTNLNAFAHVGGYVYVHTGLLKRIRDEEELRFVIGHEIAHVRLRHCAEGVLPMVRAQQAIGQFGSQLVSIAHKAIAVSYSEDREFEADEWSYRQMRLQGFTHGRAILGLQLLQRHDRTPTAKIVRAKGLGDHILEHFRTHPPVQERLRRLEIIRAEFN